MEKLRTGYQKTMMVAGSLMSWIRLSLSDNDTDYTSIRISKAIFILSVPMVLEMFMSSVFSLADMYFVSRLGSDAIATVGLTEAVVNLVYAIAFGISIATTALVSRRIGERKYRAASETALQAVLLGFIISVLIAIPGFLFTRDLLRLMGASSTMIYEMSGYMKIVLAGNFSIILIFINNAIFRSAGKPLIALKTLAVANALNIVLDPLLIFGWGPVPAMGIEGAAWATLMGRGLAVVYQLYLLNRPTGKLRFSLARRFFDRQTMFRIVTLAWSAISQNLSATISWLLLVRIISSFGSIAVAGYTIALRLLLFLLLPVAGIANATSTLVGQNLGAN
ncbi:MAG TPA: MATE family efflux transporter, partial [Bacteroidales bacterium]|nr:MATE family efflux transporter [Bacteroidales bacterium]